MGSWISFDRFARKFPVSVKAVILLNSEVILLKNERDEWELPGGKLEPKEPIATCLVREIKEELNLDVQVDRLVDSWVYNILNQIEVVIICYQCSIVGSIDSIQISHEHKEWATFLPEKIHDIPLPEGYRNAIAKCV